MNRVDRSRVRLAGLCAGLALLAGVGSARAKEPERDPVAAEAQFRAGREAFKVGDFATACPRFAESYRLDPAPGALFNLADCEEQAGRKATAWSRWQELVDLLRSTPTDPRYAVAQQHVAALGAKLSKLKIRWSGAAPAGGVIKRDGVALGAASLGVALPVDPGNHTVEVTAKGRQPVSQKILVRDGEEVDLPVKAGEPVDIGDQVADTPVPRPRTTTPPVAAPVEPARPAPARSGTSPLTIVGGIGAGLGGVLLIVGAATGGAALSAKNTVTQQCDVDLKLCTPAGATAAADGHTYATASTATLIAGGVLAGAGVVMLVLGRSKPTATKVAPLVGPGQAGLVVGGTF